MGYVILPVTSRTIECCSLALTDSDLNVQYPTMTPRALLGLDLNIITTKNNNN